MPASHEMSRARRFRRLDQKLPVRANRLKSVVLNNDGLARK
jgi:hypothetical protein